MSANAMPPMTKGSSSPPTLGAEAARRGDLRAGELDHSYWYWFNP
jgi:hypothetical protein